MGWPQNLLLAKKPETPCRGRLSARKSRKLPGILLSYFKKEEENREWG